jgi:uncharacterized protein (TIGR03118 family)
MSWAQQPGYSQTNLVSNTAGAANHVDSQLVNPWGISIVTGQALWAADNNSGVSTAYDNQGNKINAVTVTIPVAKNNPNGNCSPGCPTGTVASTGSAYTGGVQVTWDTEDGLIADWNGTGNTATVVVDRSASGAVFKGLALINGANGTTTLLAANFNSGKIEIFDSNFKPTSLSGSFTDPALPAGYAPHGIQVIGNQVYVAYAMQDAPKHDAQPGAGLGQVDIFDSNGNFVSTLVKPGGNLNAPWAVAMAPAGFGAFQNAILVGNFGDGTISAYDNTGKFLGQLADPSGKVLVNPGLWGMVFGGGGPSGDPGTLYLTAGGDNQPNFPPGGSTTAFFASLAPAAAAGGDFSLSVSSMSATVAPGGSTNVMISASAVGGFTGQISLACTAPSGLTCTLSPTSISPGSSASTSTMAISAATNPPGGVYGAEFLLPGLGLFGILRRARKKRTPSKSSIFGISALGVMLLATLFAAGCGGSGSKPMAQASQSNIVVTATAGSLSHTSTIAVTIQ